MSKAVVDLTNQGVHIDTSLDNVVMPKVLTTIPNGRTLDVSDFKESVIKGGHLLIKKSGEALYKPMPVEGEKYAALPEGFEYAGFQYGSVLKTRPFGAISKNCQYVTEAAPYALDTVLEDVKKALPKVEFITKED